MKKKTISRKPQTTFKTKASKRLADKYNKRLKEYRRVFGDDYVERTYGKLALERTKSGNISAKQFETLEGRSMIAALEVTLKPVSTRFNEMHDKVVERWNESGKQGPANTTDSFIISEIISEQKIQDDFNKLKEKFYVEVTDIVHRPSELIPRKGKGNPFTSYQHMEEVMEQMRTLIQEAKERG